MTLDDLPPIDWAGPPINDQITFCPRCGSAVPILATMMQAHERWHAAIENLTVTGTFTVIDPITKVPSFDAWTPRPIPVEPVATEDWRYHHSPTEFKTDEDSCAKHREFINRVWQIATEAGHESGTSVTDFLREQLVERRSAAASAQTDQPTERQRAELIEALGLDQNTGFHAALDVAREWRRRATSENWTDTPPVGPHSCEAHCSLDHYEEGVEGPWRQAQMDKAAAEAGPVTDQLLTDLLLRVCEPVPVERMRKWSQKDREEVARWAGLVHLQASDNDVDVPERPAFLDGPAEAEVCPSLYLTATGHLVACEQPKVDEPDLHTAMLDGHRIAWREPDAVPSPWPVDQEPPAGINLLRDTDCELVPYLARVQNGWGWLGDPNGSRTHGAIQWAEAVLDVDGDLVVVRP